MDKQKLDEIRARCEAATPGPWHYVSQHKEINEKLMDTDENGAVVGELPNGIAEIYPINRQSNAEFIAHARQDIPDLLSALENAHRRLEGEMYLLEKSNALQLLWYNRALELGWKNEEGAHAETE